MARTATADGAGAPAAGIPTTPQEPLTELMQRAVPAGPTSLVGGDPGAALALALHVQMAEYGRCFAVNKNGLENSNRCGSSSQPEHASLGVQAPRRRQLWGLWRMQCAVPACSMHSILLCLIVPWI